MTNPTQSDVQAVVPRGYTRAWRQGGAVMDLVLRYVSIPRYIELQRTETDRSKRTRRKIFAYPALYSGSCTWDKEKCIPLPDELVEDQDRN